MSWRNQGIGFVQKRESEILQRTVSYLRVSTGKLDRSGPGAASVSRLTRGRQQMRGRCVVIAIPPDIAQRDRGAVMAEANQDTRMSDRKRGAYAHRSPLSAHRPKRSSYTLPVAGGGAARIAAAQRRTAAGSP
jgi:hypothetical protein